MNLKLKKILLSIISVSFLTTFLYGVTVAAKSVEIDKKPIDTNNLGPDYYPNINEGGKVNKSLTADNNPSHIKNVVVFVQFGDENSYDDEVIEQADISYNSQIQDDNVTSLKEYVETLSYGKQKVDSIWPKKDNKVVVYKPSNDISYYTKFSDGNPNGYKDEIEKQDRESELVKEIVDNIQNMLPKDIDLDQNDDGILDMISFIFDTSPEYLDSANIVIEYTGLLWPHMNEAREVITLDGITVGKYNILSTNSKIDGIFGNESINNSVIIHEFMHSLGVPDLYRYNSYGSPVWFYDIMAMHGSSAQRLNSYYQRAYLKWGASIPEITESTERVTISVAKYKDENEKIAVKIKSGYSSKEYFIVEFRKKEGFDKEIPVDYSGLIVYRINENSPNGVNYGNSNTEPGTDFMYVYRPDEETKNQGYGLPWFSTFSSESGRTTFGKEIGKEKPQFDNETIYLSDGSNSGVEITNVGSGEGDTITFDVKIPEAPKATAEDPFLIKTVDDFNFLSNNPEAYFKLENDIDFSAIENYKGISQFNGGLDGNGKSIINLKMNSKDMAVGDSAFFRSIGEKAKIKNLTFVNPSISGNNASVLSTYMFGEIDNIKVLGGSVTSDTNMAAGLACVLNENTVIKNCYTDVNVKGSFQAAGISCVVINSSISESFALGNTQGLNKETVVGQLFSRVGVYPEKTSKIKNVYWDLNKNSSGVGKYIDRYGNQQIDVVSLDGITGVKVDKDVTFDLNKSDSYKINLTTSPENVKINGTWSSENKEIQVDNEGIVKASKVGESKLNYKLMVGTNYMNFVTNIKVTAEKKDDLVKPSTPSGESENKSDTGKTQNKLPNTGDDKASLIPILGFLMLVSGAWILYSKKFKKII